MNGAISSDDNVHWATTLHSNENFKLQIARALTSDLPNEALWWLSMWIFARPHRKYLHTEQRCCRWIKVQIDHITADIVSDSEYHVDM